MRKKTLFNHLSRAVPLFLIFLTASFGYAQVKVGAEAEWHSAKKIIMHTPGDEFFMGVIHPAAALFEKPFSLRKARKEHLNYIKNLNRQGVEVIKVVDTLLKGTVDASGKTVPGRELDELRVFAKDFLTYDTSKLSPEKRKTQAAYKDKVIAQLPPYELVRIILQRPIVRLEEINTNTGIEADYEENPLMNLYFCRDQMITTARGIVIAKMNSYQREGETRIIKFILKKLGIKPVYEVTGKGRLEGGDYFSAGNIAMIGQGLRTNAEGIKQLLDNKVFGVPKVAVVKDEWKDQEEMHLDTYFNIINPKLAVLVDLRMDLPGKPADPKMIPKVDVYELKNGKYVKAVSDKNFQKYLVELGYEIIPTTRKDQNLYGINFLTLESDRIMAIDGASEKYKKAIKDHGVKADWMEFGALTSGYGAAHCTTQVILREKPEK